MRRSTLTGLASGLLGLTLLQAFLAGNQTNNVGGLLAGVGGLLAKWADPSVPGIPDRRGSSSSSTPAPPGGLQLGPLTLASQTTPAAPSTRLPPILTT